MQQCIAVSDFYFGKEPEIEDESRKEDERD